jgi:hypothetical protein
MMDEEHRRVVMVVLRAVVVEDILEQEDRIIFMR